MEVITVNRYHQPITGLVYSI